MATDPWTQILRWEEPGGLEPEDFATSRSVVGAAMVGVSQYTRALPTTLVGDHSGYLVCAKATVGSTSDHNTVESAGDYKPQSPPVSIKLKGASASISRLPETAGHATQSGPKQYPSESSKNVSDFTRSYSAI